MAYATTTRVAVENSRAELERLLSRHHCMKFATGVDHEEHRATVQFHTHNRIVKFDVALPDPKDPKYRKIKGQYLQRTQAGVEKLVEQETRTRWRALLLVVRAKLEAVESGIATFEDEFLAHVMLPNQETVAQYIGPLVDEIYKTGRMPISRRLASGEVIDEER